MKLVVFGLTVSSSWGNGHATLWRGLLGALTRRGCEVVFFERDVPYYADNRDLHALPGGELVLYREWADVAVRVKAEVAAADAVIITSYCPDARAAAALLDGGRAQSIFYDLDTPVTLARLSAGEDIDYIPSGGLGGFDLVLSYTGGEALVRLKSELGARRVHPLYGHVDPLVHRPMPSDDRFACDLSYLGTYAADRQPALDAMFLEPARRLPALRCVLGGSCYPEAFPWTANTWFVGHVAPPDHAAFFSSSRLTVNVTRADMRALGWCPSGRLFEAAACGTAVLSDYWPGLDDFFEPGREIFVASTAEEAVAAVDLPRDQMARVSRAARERVLDEHTSDHRAAELLALLAASPADSRPASVEA